MPPVANPFMKKIAPVARAGLTSCIVMQAGDVLCQSIQRHNRGRAEAHHNWERTARFGLVGLTLHGPFFYWGFRMLDERFGPAKNLLTAVKKTSLGQVTLFPAYVTAFFTYMTLLETRGDVSAVGEKLRSTFAQTYVAGTVFWPVANVLNFMFCPPSSRILYVNGAGLIWNAILSAYNSKDDPPNGKEDRAAEQSAAP